MAVGETKIHRCPWPSCGCDCRATPTRCPECGPAAMEGRAIDLLPIANNMERPGRRVVPGASGPVEGGWASFWGDAVLVWRRSTLIGDRATLIRKRSILVWDAPIHVPECLTLASRAGNGRRIQGGSGPNHSRCSAMTIPPSFKGKATRRDGHPALFVTPSDLRTASPARRKHRSGDRGGRASGCGRIRPFRGRVLGRSLLPYRRWRGR